LNRNNWKNLNIPVLVYPERTETNPFVSDSFETSFGSCFSYIETKPVLQDTLVSCPGCPIPAVLLVVPSWLTRAVFTWLIENWSINHKWKKKISRLLKVSVESCSIENPIFRILANILFIF
jgi:hypothetical protein